MIKSMQSKMFGAHSDIRHPEVVWAVASAAHQLIAIGRSVWAIDFQFDSTIDGKAIKIASMIDEHTRESRLHLLERSITAERLVAELESVF